MRAHRRAIARFVSLGLARRSAPLYFRLVSARGENTVHKFFGSLLSSAKVFPAVKSPGTVRRGLPGL